MAGINPFLEASSLGSLGSLVVICIIAASVGVGLSHGLRSKYGLPPGPPGIPVFGNLLEWLRVRKSGNIAPWLMKQGSYGEMTTLRMGTRTWVLLNSARVVNEIISKRAGLTHERPTLPIAGGLVSRNKRLFLQKTDEWKEGRRLLHQLLFGVGAQYHDELVENATKDLLCAYLDEPEAWYAHNYRFPVSIMHRIVTNTPLDKPRHRLEDLQGVTSSFLTSINSHLVDFFPQLSAIPKPLQFWRPHWECLGNHHRSIFESWWNDMKQLDGEDVTSSFARYTMLKDYQGPEEQAMYITMLAIAAGSDNPRMATNAWVMACLAYPDAMRRARDEIESVCNGQRLPRMDDMPRLQYTCAVVKEVLRWRPIVLLTPQRVLVSDLEFEGYSFPAGTEFLVNTVSVCTWGHEEPGRFMPERWLEDGAPIKQDLWQYAFSGGKRSCLGYKLAQKELFLAFARLIYCFDFQPAPEGFDDTKLNAFSMGEPFRVQIKLRGDKYKELILG